MQSKVSAVKIIPLPASITIDTVEGLLQEFRKHEITPDASLTLDASQVTAITTPGVQLIVALKKTWEHEGGKIALTGQTPAFTETFQRLGLKEHCV